MNNLGVDVSIVEPQGVRWCNAYLTDRSLVDSTARLPQLMTRPNQQICKVSYRPSRRQQQHLSTDGIMGNFIVEYDVNHANEAGDIQVGTHGSLGYKSIVHILVVWREPSALYPVCSPCGLKFQTAIYTHKFV